MKHEKLKGQCNVRNMPKKRLLAILDRAVWKSVTKGQAGGKWGGVAVKVWEGVGGRQEETVPIGECGTNKSKVKGKIETREEQELRQKEDEEEHLNIYKGLREGKGMGTYCTVHWTM